MIPELARRLSWLLVHASIDGVVAVGVVAAATILLARRAPGLRCRLWWVACCKVLIGLAGVAPLALPVLPAALDRAAIAVRPVAAAVSALSAPADASPGWPWPVWLAFGWILGASFAGFLVLARHRHTRRILRASRPNQDPAVARTLARLSRAAGLRSVPRLHFSSDVATPQLVGIFRPIVLLPIVEGRSLPDDDLEMALCHELVHVRRRDLALGWIPAIAARLFFFHPGVVWAAREYALAREEACDAEVLRVLGVTPARYGRLLVELSAGSRRALAPAVGVSSSFRHLRRRLQMLEHAPVRPVPTTTRWVLLALVAAAVLVPVRLVARTPQAAASSSETAGDAYVLFLDKDSVTMSGSFDDLAAARALRDKKGEQVLWFRQGGREYVVSDPAVLRSIVASQAPDGERSIAADQARAYAERAELERRLELMSKNQDQLLDRRTQEETARAKAYAADAARVRQNAELAEEMARVASRMSELSTDQGAAARDLERRAMENDQRIRELLEESIRSGAAHRLGAKGTAEGGVKGGVKGGVQGGVKGGVQGGVEGGVDGGVDGDSAPPEVI